MRLILTHENGDFDAIASLLAAHRLYPDGVPILPRRVNRNVHQFLALFGGAFGFVRAEDWRRQRVDEVMLVDTQSMPNVRGVKHGVGVQIIDHHTPGALPRNWRLHYEPVGATVTILVEMLRDAGATLSPQEASLLLLGIHEDTGSLTYDTSTARDAQAAAWLLSQGGQLNVVRRFLEIPLTEAQQDLYRRLQDGSEWVTLEGQSILLAAAKAPPDFNDEISSVVHRMRDALVPDSLLVLVELSQHVQLVARSSTDHVDVGGLALKLGGGGHSRASAAMIMDVDLATARRLLLAALPAVVTPMDKVAEIMSYGVKTIWTDDIVQDAAEEMRRLGHEGYPVVDDNGQLVGLLTRRAVDRALGHELGHLPVRQVMRAGRVTVVPGDSIERVQQLMIEEGWGQIPVTSESDTSRIIGIVTRTDLLNLLSQPARASRQTDMRRLMEEMLPPVVWQMVQAISRTAAERGVPIYFVGGLVRDMLLGKPSVDVDMVVEGEAIALVEQLQMQFGGDVHTHARFGTAKWAVDESVWRRVASGVDPAGVPESLDFVTARTEFYAHPTALPEVARSSIKLDLHRRDFTINTLAVRLDGAHLGQMLDFYGGQRDLEQRLVRVLHSLSFIDDPTRILRAVRLEQRLGFTIEERTAELMADALPMLSRITGDRIRHELQLALQEPDPIPIMERLDRMGILGALHPQLTWRADVEAAFRRVPACMADPLWRDDLSADDTVVIYFILWLLHAPEPVQDAVMDRLRVRQLTRADLLAARKLLALLLQMPGDLAPSQATRQIEPHARRPRVLPIVAAALGDLQPARDLLDRYQSRWRHVSPSLNGYGLRTMGMTPGPLLGRILQALLDARLDGLTSSEAEDREMARRLMARFADEEE